MPALTCLLLLGCALGQSSSRLTSELPNGIFVMVQRLPEARRVTSRLMIASRGAEETLATQGHRHLLEHLWAKGADGKLDAALEAEGMILSAQTLRDATEFSITGPRESFSKQIQALKSLLKPRSFDLQEVKREARIVGEEVLLEPDSRTMSRLAWQAVYGANGCDPNGTASALVAATPQSLSTLQRSLLRSRHMVVAVSGPVDPETTSNQVAKAFSEIPEMGPTPWQLRSSPMKGARVESSELTGSGLAVGVPSMSEPRTVWVLAAALALAAKNEGAYVTYTPTIRNGVVLVGKNRSTAVHWNDAERPTFGEGKNLARRWLKTRLADSEQGLFWRAYCLTQAPGARLETMLENLEDMTQADFDKGVASLGVETACTIQGAASPRTRAKGLPLIDVDRGSTQAMPIGLPIEIRQDPNAEHLVVQALIPLAGLGQTDPAVATLLGRCLLLENGAYSEAKLRSFASQTGEPPLVEVLSSHIRVRLVFPPGNLATAIALLGSMVQSPGFGEANLAKARAIQEALQAPWLASLNPEVLDLGGVEQRQVEALYRAAFRPERVRVVFSGQVDGPEARRRWDQKLASWAPELPGTRLPGPAVNRFLPMDTGFGAASFELRGPEFPYWDGALATRLLMISALGIGKSGAVYRVLREANGWSYRQEAFLTPTAFGFRPRLCATSSQIRREDEKAIRDALRADIGRWSDATLKTALALLSATYDQGSWPEPVYLTGTGPLGEEPTDRDFSSLFWRAMAGQSFDWSKLAARAKMVRLEDLKDAALQFVDRASWLYVPAGKR
ncbi:MAG: insulinase family protein [Armatimonadetes bacterium]|nr:insulinase family protein [Armatimonadota bacterium]